MNLHRINIIIGREYLNRVKKKSFLIVTFLVPVLFAALCMLPALIINGLNEESKTLAVVDESSVVMPYLQDSELVSYKDCTGRSVEELKAELGEFRKLPSLVFAYRASRKNYQLYLLLRIS